MYFHTVVCGPNIGAFRSVFASAVAYARKNKINQVALAVHMKTNLNGVISDTLGEGTIKQLLKSPLLVEGVSIGLSTERIKPPFRGDIVFVAAQTSTAFLKKLESHYQRKALFYVPWLPEELAEYLQRHESVELQVKA